MTHLPPPGEELLEVVSSDGERPTAVVTRAADGARILSTERVAFVEVDLSPSELEVYARPPRLGRTLFAVMFGAAAPRPGAVGAEPALPGALRGWLAREPARGARVYRTASGLRYLLTHALFDPAADETGELLSELESAPNFAMTCRSRQAFRVRLTARPSSCGAGDLRVPYPRPEGAAAREIEKAVRAYEAKAVRFAACAFVAEVGDKRVAPGIAPIVAFHDRATRATSGLPLA